MVAETGLERSGMFFTFFRYFLLVVSFVDSKQQYDSFCDYDVFLSKSTKLSLQSRTSGGVLVFVRKHLSYFIRHIEVPYENVIVLEVCKTLLGLCKNAFIISTYIPPKTVNFGT